MHNVSLTEFQNSLLQEIKKNPTLSNSEYAILISSTAKGVQSTLAKLVKKGFVNIETLSNGRKRAKITVLNVYAPEVKENIIQDHKEEPTSTTKSKSTFETKGDKAEYTFTSDKRILSFEDLKNACDIDLTEWEVERMICNKWEVGAKDITGNINITPLFQVKVWLKPKVPILIVENIIKTIEDMKQYAPVYPVLRRVIKRDPTLFLIDIADPHFGKYASKKETGEIYNTEIAVKRYKDGFEGLLDKGSHCEHEKIVIIIGNDASHIDNPFGTTTAGTKQDVDGSWHEIVDSLKWAYIGAIERALTVSDVLVTHCMSNHDFVLGYCLAQILEAWFHNNKNVTFDVSPQHRKYIQYGQNLIGQTHGDGAKELDLPSLMSVEAKKAFSESSFLYWYCHHIHHKVRKIKDGRKHIQVEKDGKGVAVIDTGLNLEAKDKFNVEYVRSISGTDRWHSTNGYQHSFQAMEGFIHHPIYGQINRFTHLF